MTEADSALIICGFGTVIVFFQLLKDAVMKCFGPSNYTDNRMVA